MTTTAPEEVHVRRAERADLLDVARIERASFPQPWPFQAFAGFLGEPGFLVAVDEPGGPDGAGGLFDDGGGEVRGYVVADVEGDLGASVGHVKDLAVAPAWRGRGIGSTLLSLALSVLVACGARRAKLEVRADNAAARELYSAFGFRENHVVPGYYDDGTDALLLVSDLADVGGDR